MRANAYSSSHTPSTFDSVHFRRVKIQKPAPVVAQPIVTATDFSPSTDAAIEVATELALHLKAPLALAHAVEMPRTLARDAKASRWLVASRKRSLRGAATSLREKGVEIVEEVRSGPVDETILQVARDAKAQLIVVPNAGRRPAGKWRRGSVPARVAGQTHIPVLMLRDAEPLRGWLHGRRPLKVFVAYNFSASADAALRWVKHVTRVGPCEVVLAYVNEPVEDYVRIGARGPLPFGHNPPDVLAVLERDMKARARALLGDVPVRCRVEPAAGQTHVQLARLAREEGADLIVTGSRQYAGFKRLRYGSVSRALLRDSSASMAVVPLATGRDGPANPIKVKRHVLVATDFSDVGNTAVPHALALLPEGGLLTLMHVSALPPIITEHVRRDLARDAKLSSSERLAIANRLRQLVPAYAAERGILTQTEVISAADVGQSISQTAERLSVDAICLATSHRSEVSRAFLGSVTRTVRSNTQRPLLVVPVART